MIKLVCGQFFVILRVIQDAVHFSGIGWARQYLNGQAS